jgi:hypothetical protein
VNHILSCNCVSIRSFFDAPTALILFYLLKILHTILSVIILYNKKYAKNKDTLKIHVYMFCILYTNLEEKTQQKTCSRIFPMPFFKTFYVLEKRGQNYLILDISHIQQVKNYACRSVSLTNVSTDAFSDFFSLLSITTRKISPVYKHRRLGIRSCPPPT